MKLEKEPISLKETGRARHFLEGEIVDVYAFANTPAIRTTASMNSGTDFNAYVERAIERQQYVLQHRSGHIITTITFKEPQKEQKAVDMIFSRGGQCGVLKVVDSTEKHTVFCPTPIDNVFIENLEKEIRKIQKDETGGSEFTFDPRVASIYAYVPVEEIPKLQSLPEIYLVDVGPVDFQDEYLKFREHIKIGPTLDVFYKLRKFASPKMAV